MLANARVPKMTSLLSAIFLGNGIVISCFSFHHEVVKLQFMQPYKNEWGKKTTLVINRLKMKSRPVRERERFFATDSLIFSTYTSFTHVNEE